MDLQQNKYKEQQQELNVPLDNIPQQKSDDKTKQKAKLKAGQCPQCGMQNDPDAIFCENCGAPLRECLCPKCSAPIEPGTDFCEACGSYIAKDRCSFCSAPLTDADSFCPECSAPRCGMECPVCHSVSQFAFCSVCGTALTDSAQAELEKAWDVPFKSKLQNLVEELENLWMTAPVTNALQRRRREQNEELRRRVLQLLEEDGETLYKQNREPELLLDEGELHDQIEQKRKELQALLDNMVMPEQESPAQARIYSMARKPGVSRLGWKCNYKHALHSSPLGCACPQKGGKWIVLGSQDEGQVFDEK